ncbi:hypothetical protein ACU4GD_19580 [Cupriavidus basilensis]
MFVISARKSRLAIRQAHRVQLVAFRKNGALNDAQADAAAEHYVALPPGLVKQIETYWRDNFK